MASRALSRIQVLAFCAGAFAQTAPPPPDVVAGIPVNRDEAKAGGYTLPDPLMLLNGEPMRDTKIWNAARRPELVHLYEGNQFGRAPVKPANVTYDISLKFAGLHFHP